jgi:hypothetical protein
VYEHESGVLCEWHVLVGDGRGAADLSERAYFKEEILEVVTP